MGLWAALGRSIEFEVLASPIAFDATRNYTFAKHDVVEGRPRLQWLSQDLEELTLRLRWHVAFTQPQARYDAMTAAAAAARALPLTFGNGILRGWYVIVEISETIEVTADDGSLIAIECTVKLTEYAMSPTLEETAIPDTPAPAIDPSVPAQPGRSAIAWTAPPSPLPDPAASGATFGNFNAALGHRTPEMACRVPEITPGL
jgi:phage protein U